MNRILVLAVAILSPFALVSQAPPTVVHAQVSAMAASKGLAAAIDFLVREKAPMWVGYQMPVEGGFHTGSNAGRTAFLEGGGEFWGGRDSYGKDMTYDHVVLLLRLAGGGVEKLRVESPERELDAGGLRFVWLMEVTAADSIRTLRSLAVKGGTEKLRQDAVFMISLHRDAEATPVLVSLAGPEQELNLREKVAFWLANQRGHEGFVVLQRLARQDADAKFREKLTFDLTLCHEPAALDELVRMAHSDASPQVRRQAQFWMAALGGKKVASDLRNLAEQDPKSEVRKSAVFALSRLPGDEATTQLIQVAQTSHDAAVRKQAVFWLGQPGDPRALDYLTGLLKQ